VQSFFNNTPDIEFAIAAYPNWDYVRRGLTHNLEIVQSYYKERVLAVKSNHLLCRIINTLTVPYSLDVYRYHANIEEQTYLISNHFKISSPVYRGGLINSVFYDPEGLELLVVDNSYFDPQETSINWKNAQAVKVVKHPRSDLSLLLPNGKSTGSEKGISVISINIPMLAVQYRAFLKEQLKKSPDYYLSVSHFVHMYVLPNMLYTHLDLALYNRLSNLVLGAPMGEATRKHAMAIIDYSEFVDKIYTKILSDLEKRNMDFKIVTQTVPVVVNDTLEQTLVLPDNPHTRQILWIDLFCRIDEFMTIMKIAGDRSVNKNRQHLNTTLKYVRMVERDDTIEKILPSGLYLDLSLKISELKQLSGVSY
jgi:hypothetical protein